MRDRRLWIEIAVAIAVAVIAFFLGRAVLPSGPVTTPSPTPAVADPSATGPTPPEVVSARETLPPRVTVPERGDTTPSNVAAPAAVVPAGPDTTIKKRSFDLRVEGDSLSPDTVIVEQGDIVNITVTAVGRDYDFVQPDYGMGFSVAAGEVKTIQNQFTQTGKFMLYCSSCGGPAAGPRGYIMVVPKNAP